MRGDGQRSGSHLENRIIMTLFIVFILSYIGIIIRPVLGEVFFNDVFEVLLYISGSIPIILDLKHLIRREGIPLLNIRPILLIVIVIVLLISPVFLLFETNNTEVESPEKVIYSQVLTQKGERLLEAVYPQVLALHNDIPVGEVEGNEFKVNPISEDGDLNEFSQVIVVYPDGWRTVNLNAEYNDGRITRYAYYGFGDKGGFPPKGYYIWEFVKQDGDIVLMAYYYNGIVLNLPSEVGLRREGDNLIAYMIPPENAEDVAFWISPFYEDESLPYIERAVYEFKKGEKVTVVFQDPPLEEGHTYIMNFHSGHENSYSLKHLLFIWIEPLKIIEDWNPPSPEGVWGYENYGYPYLVHVNPAPNSIIFSSPDNIMLHFHIYIDDGEIGIYKDGKLIKQGTISGDEELGYSQLTIDMSGKTLDEGAYKIRFRVNSSQLNTSGTFSFQLKKFDVSILDAIYCPGDQPCPEIRYPLTGLINVLDVHLTNYIFSEGMILKHIKKLGGSSFSRVPNFPSRLP